MIRPVIPARKVSQGRRSDRGAFLQDVSIGDSSSVSKDTITARTVEKKKNVHFFFFFFQRAADRDNLETMRQNDNGEKRRSDALLGFLSALGFDPPGNSAYRVQ